jgi:hypothetical protein
MNAQATSERSQRVLKEQAREQASREGARRQAKDSSRADP